MGRAPLACLSLALVASLASVPAFAQRAAAPPKPAGTAIAPQAAPADVGTAEQLYAKLDYEGANAVAERVVKKVGLTHDQLVRAYRVLAVTYAILDKGELARDAFLQVLTYDPDYQVDPNLGPKVNTPFMEARGSFRSLSAKPGIEVAATVSSRGGTLRVTTHDPTRIVKQINVGYRWTSSGTFSNSRNVNPADGIVAVEIASPPPGRTRLDFYVQALDDRENVVLEAGNPSVPKSAFAEAGGAPAPAKENKAEASAVFSSPLFWIAAGVAVIGAGSVAYLAFRPQDPPTRATLSPVIVCGSDRCN